MAPLHWSSTATIWSSRKSPFRKSPKTRSSPRIPWGNDPAGGDNGTIVSPCWAGWYSGTKFRLWLLAACGKPSPLVLLAHRFRICWHDSGGLHPGLDLVLYLPELGLGEVLHLSVKELFRIAPFREVQ